jgi:hypothetical protein
MPTDCKVCDFEEKADALEDIIQMVHSILLEYDTFNKLQDAEYSYEELKEVINNYLF